MTYTNRQINGLIAEARNHVEHYPLSDGDALRVSRLADALAQVKAERDELMATLTELEPVNYVGHEFCHPRLGCIEKGEAS